MLDLVITEAHPLTQSHAPVICKTSFLSLRPTPLTHPISCSCDIL
jgi:hypothetical protein